MDDINYISIKEFREKGYLQELNRRFLHPLGLALEVSIDDQGNESLGGIWDYRADPEGIHYGLKESNLDRVRSFIKNKRFIQSEIEKRYKKRVELLGSYMELIPDEVE